MVRSKHRVSPAKRGNGANAPTSRKGTGRTGRAKRAAQHESFVSFALDSNLVCSILWNRCETAKGGGSKTFRRGERKRECLLKVGGGGGGGEGR